ncbi:E3 ubiquitin-protein ligase TRIM39-like [Scyliorhinus canicula]|uniref:E3 ubiquitin-protein ligase TRIM39-like n=1 Tax=Scyliorhinus canicula TaxID=7830 RepID=UPI0018F282D6|nr:E3 ubiquitin-protein ligase TRIM39-like [Scyliorhinus canicula]XP_038635842.1 E3 ubiquitin-protein ligase TRIM39-like [Scyliorhinus canicula]
MSVEDDIRSQFSCSICLDTFKDPVTTECEHDFCRPCITEYWDREETSICPLCRQYSSGTLRTNRTLACVVEILQSKKGNSSAETESSGDNNFGFLLLVILIFVIVLLWSLSPDASSLGFYPKDYDMCPQHKEKLKLFCEDDQELICLICRDSNKHKNHRVYPINEAARYYKHELALMVESLKKKHVHHQIIKANYEENLTQLMDEVSLTEQRIGRVFVHLHEYLRLEEENIMQELHSDAWQHFTVLEEIIMQLAFESTSISDTIQSVSEDLTQEDAIIFLMKLKSTQDRIRMATSDPKDVSVKIDGAKYKFLMLYNSWKKMVKEIGFNTASLSLDSDSAHWNLLIFNNMTSVTYSHNLKKPPSKTSRFSVYPFVLAKQGFSSGVHYWEVFVGCKADWVLGVTKQSVQRKAPISLAPQDGLWTLEKKGRHYVANSVPHVVIFSGFKPKKIGIYLDYEAGQVSFYNADKMNLMYTFKDTFTETLYPLFSPGINFTPLRILHVNP